MDDTPSSPPREDRQHDASFRRLFAHPALLQSLIEDFLGDDFKALAARLDFDQAERVNTAFITEALARFESDMLWKLPLRPEPDEEGGADELYVCVLLEFQSSVDASMAFRMLNYIALFYLQLCAQKPDLLRAQRLPPILPIVLYNGKPKWHAACSVEELIAVEPTSPLFAFVPRLTFKLVDVVRLDPDSPQAQHTALGGLFMMEQTKDPSMLSERLHHLVQLLQDGKLNTLKEDLLIWLAELLKPYNIALTPEHLPSFEEVHIMLAESIALWEKKIEDKARAQGVEQGVEHGALLARRELLSRQVQLKFGEQPALVEHIHTMSAAQLDTAIDRIITASSPDDLFTSSEVR